MFLPSMRKEFNKQNFCEVAGCNFLLFLFSKFPIRFLGFQRMETDFCALKNMRCKYFFSTRSNFFTEF